MLYFYEFIFNITMDKSKKMPLLKKEMCELLHVICNSLDTAIVNEITTSINKTLEDTIEKLDDPLNKDQITRLEYDYKMKLETILRDTYKNTLIDALNRVYDICVNGDVDGFVYEDRRYLMTTRDMQKIKEAHRNKPSWSIVRPIYKKIFDNIYIDIHPDTELRSKGDLEDVSYKAVNCKTVRRKNAFNATRKKWVTYIKNVVGYK